MVWSVALMGYLGYKYEHRVIDLFRLKLQDTQEMATYTNLR